MRKVWIVSANSSIAKIYAAENTHKIIEFMSLEHKESHLPAHELVSDNQGRMTSKGIYGSETMDAKTPLKLKEALRFADEISDILEEGWKKGEFERLYIVAKAPFLGHLREALSPHVEKLVHTEIGKDLTQLSPEQVREYLPPVF